MNFTVTVAVDLQITVPVTFVTVFVGGCKNVSTPLWAVQRSTQAPNCCDKEELIILYIPQLPRAVDTS